MSSQRMLQKCMSLVAVALGCGLIFWGVGSASGATGARVASSSGAVHRAAAKCAVVPRPGHLTIASRCVDAPLVAQYGYHPDQCSRGRVVQEHAESQCQCGIDRGGWARELRDARSGSFLPTLVCAYGINSASQLQRTRALVAGGVAAVRSEVALVVGPFFSIRTAVLDLDYVRWAVA